MDGIEAARVCGYMELFDWSSETRKEGTPIGVWKSPKQCSPWVYPSRLCCDQVAGGAQFDRITSPNGKYVLVMQDDGHLVQYEYATARVMWIQYGVPGTVLRMQSDGNLVLVAPGNVPIWSSGTDGRGGIFLEIQDNGSFVIHGNSGVIWTNHAR